MLVQVVEQQRGPGIGASMAAECLGVSPYGSPITAFLKLTGRLQSTAGEAAFWGQVHEPTVRAVYAAKHGYDRPGEIEIVVPTASLYHPEFPWLRATPDGIVRQWLAELATINGVRVGYLDQHLVQVKTVDARILWHWGLSDRNRSPPPHYRVQSVVEMAVTRLPRCEFAVLCGGNKYFEVAVERDRELEDMTIEQLARFWDALQRDEPPDLDESDDWRVYFADRLPKVKAEVIATGDTLDWIEAWRDARDRAVKAEADEALAKNQLLAIAVDAGATTIASPHGPIQVVRSTNKAPYMKAPTSWAVDKEIQ